MNRTSLSALALAAALAAPSARAAVTADPATEVSARAAQRGADAASLVAPVREAERRGLPAQVVADKVLEGLAKGVPADRVAAVAVALVDKLSEAQAALDAAPAGVAPPRDRASALADLATALGAGVGRAAVEDLLAAARSKDGGADGAVAAARVVAGLGRRGVALADAMPLGRAIAANPRSASDVVPAFDAWRAGGGRDPRAFLADAQRRIAEGRAIRADRVGGGDGDRARGTRDAAREDRGGDRERMGGDGGRTHGRGR